jgi:hypothetical protein
VTLTESSELNLRGAALRLTVGHDIVLCNSRAVASAYCASHENEFVDRFEKVRKCRDEQRDVRHWTAGHESHFASRAFLPCLFDALGHSFDGADAGSVFVDGEQSLHVGVLRMGKAFNATESVDSMDLWIMLRGKDKGPDGTGIDANVGRGGECV